MAQTDTLSGAIYIIYNKQYLQNGVLKIKIFSQNVTTGNIFKMRLRLTDFDSLFDDIDLLQTIVLNLFNYLKFMITSKIVRVVTFKIDIFLFQRIERGRL